MPNESGSQKKFEEALHLLNEAAREKKGEIQELLSGKYEHIREALEDTADMGRKRFGRFKKQAERQWDEGAEQIQDTVSDLDEKIRDNPWTYVAGVAIGALILGFLIGSSKEK